MCPWPTEWDLEECKISVDAQIVVLIQDVVNVRLAEGTALKPGFRDVLYNSFVVPYSWNSQALLTKVLVELLTQGHSLSYLSTVFV